MNAIKCASPIYNITDSFKLPMVKPFAELDLPLDILSKVMRGEICIILCLDIMRFIELANSIIPDYLSLAGKKESGLALKESVLFMKINNRVVKDKFGALLGQGLIDRIIFDLQYPRNIIEMHAELRPADNRSETPA